MALRTTLVLLLLLHFGVVAACLRALDTLDTPIFGFTFLRSDVSVGSFDGNTFAAAQTFAVLGLLIWGFGIPALGAIILCRNRHTLHNPEVISLYGGLYEGIRVPSPEQLTASEQLTAHTRRMALRAQPNFWYWELLVAVPRKLLLAIAVAAIRTPALQASVILLVLTVALVVQVAARPYAMHSLNVIEALSLGVLWMSAFSGLVLADGDILSTGAVAAVEGVTAAVNASFLAGTLLVVALAVMQATIMARQDTRAWLHEYQDATEQDGAHTELPSGCLWPCHFGARRGVLAWLAAAGLLDVQKARQWAGDGKRK